MAMKESKTLPKSEANDDSQEESKKYYAVGFGSNYFHPFGDSAIKLSDVCALSPPTDGGTTGSSTDGDGSISNTNTNTTTNTNGNDIAANTNTINTTHLNFDSSCGAEINAYLFPLHPNQTSKGHDTKAAQKQTKGFIRFLRRRRKQKKDNRANAKEPADIIRQALATVASTDNPFELPYGSETKPAVELAAGMTHAAFVNDEGIYMLGTLHGVTYPYPTMKHAKIPLKCTQIACGRRHILALFEGKITMSWGSGYFGQLGHGLDKVYCDQPTVIERLMPRHIGGEVVSIAAGGMQSAAIITGDSSNWSKRHTLKEVETRVFRWGSNKHGQCAIEGGKCNAVAHPTPMLDVYHPESGKRVSFVSLALGKLHSVGLTHQGELYSWGSTASGRCGHGDVHTSGGSALKSAMKMRDGVSLARRVEALRNVKIVQISAGDAHTLALSGSGRVFSWGCNSSGQLGVGHAMHLLSPRFIADLEFGQGARGFAKGEISQAAETPSKEDSEEGGNGEMHSDNSGSNLGSVVLAPIHYPPSPQKKATQRAGSTEPIPVITSIHGAGSYSAAVSSSGDVYTWGCGEANQLGHPMPTTTLPSVNTRASVQGTGSSLRTRDVNSFDSRLNVLIPRRVECLRQVGLKVENLVTSPNFMLAVCAGLDKDVLEDEESYLMGRTLFELENERREKGLGRIRLLRGSQRQDSDDVS